MNEIRLALASLAFGPLPPSWKGRVSDDFTTFLMITASNSIVDAVVQQFEVTDPLHLVILCYS